MRAVFMFFSLFALLAAAEDVLSTWQKRMLITFSGYDDEREALSNFPALVVFSNTPAGLGFGYEDFLAPPYNDLRFAADDITTPLDFEIQLWDTNGLSLVWVRLPELTNNLRIYALWGKAGAALPPCATDGSVWTNEFLGVWHLDETNGTTARDAIRNRYPGTLSGTTAKTGAAGRLGPAFSFGGNNGYVTMNVSLSLGATVTISAWASKNAGTSGMMWSRATYNPDLWFYNNVIYLNSGDGQANPFCAVPAGSDQLRHYTTVIDKTKPKASLYIDGQLASSSANYKNPAGTPLKISSGCGYDWTGVIDEFTVASVPRSADWIWASYLNMASNSVFNAYGDPESQGGPIVTNLGTVSLVDYVTLNGYLISTGKNSEVSAAVFWGTNDVGKRTDGWTYTNEFPGWAAEGPLSTNVIPDETGVLYYFRFFATNSLGDAWANPAGHFMWWSDIHTGSVFSTW